MLASHVLSRGIQAQLPLSFHWMNTTIRLKSKYESSSDSSSSDSSSDSDNEAKNKPLNKTSNVGDTQNVLNTDTFPELVSMVDRMANKRFSSKPIAIALKPKVKADQHQPPPGMSHIQQLSWAAANVAKKMGGDTKRTTSELLNQAQSQRTRRTLEKGSVLQKLVEESQKQLREKEDAMAKRSIIRDLQKEHYKKPKWQTWRNTGQFDAAVTEKGTSFFGSIADRSADVPVLKTWEMLESRSLMLLETHTPQNVFQELIQWTDQGKLWKFPIDNEQGMEEEHSVHFSEHVFMDRHLKDWCPRKGPVRHYMELVCVGLSKNPYMTVEEKVEHIMWYKQYFGEKQDLLMEIGAVEGPILKPTEKLEA